MNHITDRQTGGRFGLLMQRRVLGGPLKDWAITLAVIVVSNVVVIGTAYLLRPDMFVIK